MLKAFILAACALAGAPFAVAEPTADNGQLSWGKLGVSYFDYRVDALECTSQGTMAVLPETPSQFVAPAPVINPLSGEAEPPSASDMIMAERLRYYNASQQARDKRQDIVDACLLARGYTPFLLTREQRAQLRRLEHGSQARRDYLYVLAIDANVLGRQVLGGPTR